MNPTPPKSTDKPLRWYSNPRTLLRTILMLDDTPHSIALGSAIGMFVGLTPTVGIQMILVVLISFVTRPFFQFNRMAGILMVYVSNPITMVPLYWLDYKVGSFFIEQPVSNENFAKTFQFEGPQDTWQNLLTLFADVGWALLIGSLIIGTIGAVLTYPIMRWLVGRMRLDPPSTDSEADEPVRCSTN